MTTMLKTPIAGRKMASSIAGKDIDQYSMIGDAQVITDENGAIVDVSTEDGLGALDKPRGRKRRQQQLKQKQQVPSSNPDKVINEEGDDINPETIAQTNHTKSSAIATNGTVSAANGLTKRRDKSDGEQLPENNDTEAGEDLEGDEPVTEIDDGTDGDFKAALVWRNIILFVILHSGIPVGAYLIYLKQYYWPTLAWSLFLAYASALGVTGGAHRLWSHKTYKAHWSVHVLLMILQTMAGQNSIYTWSRDHRVHHKFSETNADPHNIHRGFFFAHMGWLCVRKHPAVKEKGALIDMSDLKANKVVMFQHRNFWWLSALITVIIPVAVPMYLWNERFITSFVWSFMIRYMLLLHSTWLVNSAAHYVGHRPYDKRIEARESLYAIWSGLGEGFHNYHHTFPYDYRASEWGRFWNITTGFIDLCARIGLVYDRRRVDEKSIERRRAKTGETKWSKWQSGVGKGINQSERDKQDKPDHGAGSTAHANGHLSNGATRSTANGTGNSNGTNPLAPLNNIIHELPYISGLTSLQFTM